MENVVEANVQKPASPLSDRNFRLLWIGESISLLGDQFYMIALPWLVLQMTGSALALGTVDGACGHSARFVYARRRGARGSFLATFGHDGVELPRGSCWSRCCRRWC